MQLSEQKDSDVSETWIVSEFFHCIMSNDCKLSE